MAKKAIKYDQLNVIPQWFLDPNSPVAKEVRGGLAKYEAEGEKLDPKSPAYEAFARKYNSQLANAYLSKIATQLGGAIPSRKEAEDFDYAQRAGGDPEKEAVLRQGATDSPYSQAYNMIEQLQKMVIPETKPTAAPVARKPMTYKGGGDDEKLSETALGLLYGLSQAGSGGAQPGGSDPIVADDFYNMDTPLTGPNALPRRR